MIKYKKGDLIAAAKNGEVNVIAHQCNCFCNMGRGIAPLIAKAFPSAEKADNDTRKGDEYKLGTYSVAYDAEYGVYIFNLYGQYGHWKRSDGKINTDYEALRRALRGMADLVFEEDKIGLPKVGCGLGGGDWSIVSAIIDEELGEFDVTIYEL